MKRRRLLAFVAVGTVGSIPGCLDQLAGDSSAVCEAPVIIYDDLPDQAREEVDAALETGEYETEGDLLWSEITESEPDLFTGDALYHSNTAIGDDASRLWFDRDEGRDRDLTIVNETADDLTAQVSVNRQSADEPLLTETVTLVSGEQTQWRRVFPGYGTYELILETDNRSETLVWDYPPSAWATYDAPRVTIDAERIEMIAPVAEPGLPDEYNCARIWGTRDQ